MPTVEVVTHLDRDVTVRSKPLRSGQACLPNGVIVPAHNYLWYYTVDWPDGRTLATLHMGEGVVPADGEGLWRVARQNGIRTLMTPGTPNPMPAASFFLSNMGMFDRSWRVTTGDDRMGGYILEGKGWRGSRLFRSDGKRVLNLWSDGDPPKVFHLAPASTRPEVPMPVVMLIAYVLTERELRQGSYIPRPGPSDADEY